MNQKTMTCPTGCHEDYLIRESFENHEKICGVYGFTEQVRDYGTHYFCSRCNWRATWSKQHGLEINQEPIETFDVNEYEN